MSYTSVIKGTVLFVTMAVASIAVASLLRNGSSDDAIPVTLLLGYTTFRTNAVEENGNGSNDIFQSVSQELNVKSDAAMQSRWLFLDGNDDDNNVRSSGESDEEREIETLDLFAIDSVTGLQNDDTDINNRFDTTTTTTSTRTSTIENVDALPLLSPERLTTSSLTSSQPSPSDTTANTTTSNAGGASRKLFVATDNDNDHDFHDFFDLLSAQNELADHDKLRLCIDFFLPPSKDCSNSSGKGSKSKSGSKSSKGKDTKGKSDKSAGKSGTKGIYDKGAGKSGTKGKSVTKGKSDKSTGKNDTKGNGDKSTGKNDTKGKGSKGTGKSGTKGKGSKSTGKSGTKGKDSKGTGKSDKSTRKNGKKRKGSKGTAENSKSWEYNSGGKNAENANESKDGKNVKSASSKSSHDEDKGDGTGANGISATSGSSAGKDGKEGKSKAGKASSKGVDGTIDYGKDDSKGGKSSTKSGSKGDSKSGKKENRFTRLLAPQELDSNHVRKYYRNRTERNAESSVTNGLDCIHLFTYQNCIRLCYTTYHSTERNLFQSLFRLLERRI